MCHSREMIFSLDVKPLAMPRPRFSRDGRTFYTKGKMIKEHKQQVKDEFFKVAREKGYKDDVIFKGDTPVLVYIRFYFKIPVNDPKYLKEDKRAGRVRHLKKPDLDNLIKTYLDALNPTSDDPRGAWEDDRQVVSIGAKKLYADKPRVEIMVREITDGE